MAGVCADPRDDSRWVENSTLRGMIFITSSHVVFKTVWTVNSSPNIVSL
jgi:hypothetical protein